MSSAVSLSPQEAENGFLEGLRSQYEAKGYSFVVHPRRSELPNFLMSYQPDAVALKAGKNIAIEVKSRATPVSEQSLREIRKLFERQPDWQLTVAYFGADDRPTEILPTLDKSFVLNGVEEARKLVRGGHFDAAFVMAWSLLEAALNSTASHAERRPRLPGTVVQTLAMEGYISSEAEQKLLQLIQLRNRVVHGDLMAMPTRAEVDVVLSAVVSTVGST